MPPFAVPAEVTTYVCYVFALPTDAKYHVIAAAPLVQNYDVIHHMIIYGCNERPG